MKISRVVGTVSETLNIFINDVTVSTGAGLANVIASSVSYSWCRNDQATISSGTCTTGTLGTFGVSSLVQASSTSSLGWYQFGVPNGVFVSGTSAFVHLYGAPNMVPVPLEIELTKSDNQSYLSTQQVSTIAGGVRVSSITPPVGVSSGTWLTGVSTVTDKTGYSGSVNVSATAIEFGVSTIVPVGVSSGRISVSTLVGVSSGTWLAGVSTVTDKTGYSGSVSVSTLVGVSSGTWLAGVSTVTDKTGYSGRVSVSTLVGVSSGTWLAGVSTVTDKTGYSGTVNVSSFDIPVGVSTAVLLDPSYGDAGKISTNIAFVRGVAVGTGTGTSSDPWGP